MFQEIRNEKNTPFSFFYRKNYNHFPHSKKLEEVINAKILKNLIIKILIYIHLKNSNLVYYLSLFPVIL